MWFFLGYALLISGLVAADGDPAALGSVEGKKMKERTMEFADGNQTQLDLLLQLQAENVALRETQQKIMDKIHHLPSESRLIQLINETVRSEIKKLPIRMYDDDTPTTFIAIDYNGTRPCSGKILQTTTSGEWSERFIHKLVGQLRRAPDGTVCIGSPFNPSPNDNFMVFHKTGYSMSFQGTQSKDSSFTSFTSYGNWTVEIDAEGIPCMTGTRSIPSERWGTISGSYDVRRSRYRNERDCFYIGWLVDDDGKVVDVAWVDHTFWY